MSYSVRQGEEAAFAISMVDADAVAWNPTGSVVEVRLGPLRGGARTWFASTATAVGDDGYGLSVTNAEAGLLRLGLPPTATKDLPPGPYALTVWVDNVIAASGLVQIAVAPVVT
jgi:hypothetical protein